MKTASRFAFLLLILMLASMVTGFSSPDQKQKATWVWYTNQVVTAPDEFFAFAKENGVNLLYFKFDTSRSAAYYQPFMKRAHEAKIEVRALGGKPSWGLQQNQQEILAMVDWVHNYNRSVTLAEKINGIHLDIEPYVMPEWKTGKDAINRQWMSNVQAYIKRAKTDPALQVSCDIPFWLDKTMVPDDPDTSMTEWLIAQHDQVTVMAYRDRADGSNSISSLVPQELAMADALGKKMLIAVETKVSSEGDFVTFYEEGKAYMNAELDKLPALLSSHPSFQGIAVHSYEYWKTLKDE